MTGAFIYTGRLEDLRGWKWQRGNTLCDFESFFCVCLDLTAGKRKTRNTRLDVGSVASHL